MVASSNMTNQRSEAEAIAICLELALAKVPDAIHWADSQIQLSDIPDVALCNVSMAWRNDSHEVASMLRQLPGRVDSAFVGRRLIECLAMQLKNDRSSARQVAFALYELSMDESLPAGPLRKEAWWFLDAFVLSESGYIKETTDQISEQMMAMLETALESQQMVEQPHAVTPTSAPASE